MSITPRNALKLFSSHALLDVRSETEFEKTGIPGFSSMPLLYQSERCQVGCTYKTQGQEAAIALGHKLVDPHRDERVAAWRQKINESPSKEGVVMCWRGGLRSKIASAWIQEAGGTAEQLEGGYRAVRHIFLEVLKNPPPLLKLCGLTGSGKTEMIRQLGPHGVDIEKAASHRGSSFGRMNQPQPSQTVFENKLAIQLLKPFAVIEDESRVIGSLVLPEPFFQVIRAAPRIFLQVSIEERVQRIYEEYVCEPLAQGVPLTVLEKDLSSSLTSLKRRLDSYYTPLHASLLEAFRSSQSLEAHSLWIKGLLEHYYDKLYFYATNKIQNPYIFSGNPEECRAFLKTYTEGLC